MDNAGVVEKAFSRWSATNLMIFGKPQWIIGQ